MEYEERELRLAAETGVCRMTGSWETKSGLVSFGKVSGSPVILWKLCLKCAGLLMGTGPVASEWEGGWKRKKGHFSGVLQSPLRMNKLPIKR